MQPPPARFVCSKCGGTAVHVDEDRTVMDARYPTGYCDRCTPVPKPKLRPGTTGSNKGDWVTPPRRTIVLVRADLDDPADREHRRRVEHARRLAKAIHDPKKIAKMSKAQLAEASAAVAWLRRAE